jgi:tetratricopeptide (TPR) repeat protein
VTEERFGPRVLALAGLWLLLSGLLLVLSFVVVALISFSALLVVLLAIGSRRAWERVGVADALSDLLVAAADVAVRFGARARRLGIRRRARRFADGVRRAAADTPGRAGVAARWGIRTYAILVHRLNIRISQLLRSGGSFGPVSRSRQALELNELGAQLRRRGAHEEAVEQHRVALEINRDLGDEQAEALTLNSLALALAQSGAAAEAVEHLEQARDVLRELGDEEHEGQVIANLGLVYRRQGQSEEAAILFQEALERLSPESSAYRQIAEELRRAS